MPKGKKPTKNNITLDPLPSKGQGNDRKPKFNFSSMDTKGYRISDLDAQCQADLAIRLEKLSELTWQTIMDSSRHSFGTELLPVEKLKPRDAAVKCPNKKALVFRRNGKLDVMVGYRPPNSRTFEILWVEKTKGDLYNHGR